MNYKHSCVVDANGVYQTFVLVLLGQDGDGAQTETVQGYTLAEGEQLIDTALPAMRQHAGTSGFITPKWDSDTSAWTEGSTAEEIAAWEAEHPDPVPLEDKRAAKTAAMSAACNAAITAGLGVTTPPGTAHLSPQETVQMHLAGAGAGAQPVGGGYPFPGGGAV